MRKSTKSAVVAGTVLALTGGGVAFAYWTTSGTGTGTGTTTAGVTDQLNFSQNTLTAMYPGDKSQDLTVTVTNASGESAYVSGVSAYITTGNDNCDGSNFMLAGAAAPSDAANAVALTWKGQDLASNGSAEATSTIQFNDKGTEQNACKGATVTVHYLAN